MKLITINGSPRGVKSNSNVIINWIKEALDEKIEMSLFYALNRESYTEAIDSINDNDVILIVFPLYVDSMPYVLKAFMEAMDSIANTKKNVKIYYVVQSGFGGANHCRFVEKYLVYFAKYMGFEYMGTAIKPSGEGLRLMPPNMLKHTRSIFQELANDISKAIPFNPESLRKLIGFEKPGFLYKVLIRLGLGNFYFRSKLKKSGKFKERYFGPYQK